MRVLRFTLSGKTAFFKKPEVNTYFYFTFGCVHKIALMGMFGATLGYGGYSQMEDQADYPEFYEKLKDLKIAIVPHNDYGYIPKKIQSFNNSVGYASYEQGGNLIVKEQWLENPSWDIYVLINDLQSERLADYIINRKSIYMPYLGKNDHPADIKDAAVIDIATVVDKKILINSLVPKEFVQLDVDMEEGDPEGRPFKYEEKLPVSLDPNTNLYQLKSFIYSNLYVLKCDCEVVSVDGVNVVFF